MRRIVKVDIPKSINKGWLIFQEDLFDKFEQFFRYFFFSIIVIIPCGVIFIGKFNNADKLFSSIFFPPIILVGVYLIYRTATEKKLIKLVTPYDKKITKQKLLDFAQKKEFEIYRNSNDYLIFNELTNNFSTLYKKSMILIIKDHLILFTILQDNYKLNIPTLVSHLFLKHDLKKLFSEPY